MKNLLIAVVAALLAQQGLADIERSQSGREGVSGRAYTFEFENGQYQIEMASVAALKTTEMRGSGGVSVRGAPKLPAVDRWMKREMLLVNGGFANGGTDQPDGLLIANGNGVALPDRSRLRADPDSPCEFRRVQRWRLSGLLCVGGGGRLEIRRYSDASFHDCQQAVQAGPLLVENGRVAVCERSPEERDYRRTVACLSDDRVKLLVTAEPVDLYQFAQWLSRPAGEGGAACQVALNLSSGGSSGAIYTSKNAHQIGKKPNFYGDGSYPLASFLVIRPLAPK